MNAQATQSEPRPRSDDPEGPALNPLREFRLAIVMYGGVSLSIYMNGVGQELFHLVRSTAPSVPHGEDAVPEPQLVGSEKAYRRLAQVLGETPRDPMLVQPQDPILATFVIDVLTGSSAGGINSVFLAKALSNDQEMAGSDRPVARSGGYREAPERPRIQGRERAPGEAASVVAQQSADVRRPARRLRPDGGEEPIRSTGPAHPLAVRR